MDSGSIDTTCQLYQGGSYPVAVPGRAPFLRHKTSLRLGAYRWHML
jgi:hypothetical protein